MAAHTLCYEYQSAAATPESRLCGRGLPPLSGPGAVPPFGRQGAGAARAAGPSPAGPPLVAAAPSRAGPEPGGFLPPPPGLGRTRGL